MFIKPELQKGLKVLSVMYSNETIYNNINEIFQLYTLCSETEDWVAILELKWDFNLTDDEAIKFWHILKTLRSREYL